VVLKDGWLNRQFDQVSKNVHEWPEWMKRAAGLDEDKNQAPVPATTEGNSNARRGKPAVGQQRLGL
jgi:hypothetical protein